MKFTLLILLIFNSITLQAQTLDHRMRLGVLAPFVGDFAAYGEEIRKGIEFAKIQLEAQGIKTEMFYEDACLPKDVNTSVSKLINQNKIQAIVGSYCVIGMLSSKHILEAAKIISFQTSGGTSEILEPEKFLFTTSARTADEGRKLAEYAFINLRLKKIALLYLQTQWGEEINNSFQARFTELGGVITGSASNLIGENNFRNELTRLRINNPEGLIIAHLGGTLGTAIKQARSFGFKDIILLGTSDAEDNVVIDLAGESANGFRFLSPKSFNDNKEVLDFSSKFFNKFGENASALSRHAYDAMIIAVNSLKKCNLNAECARDDIHKIKNYKGASGVFSIDADGGTTRSFVVRGVEDQQFKEIE